MSDSQFRHDREQEIIQFILQMKKEYLDAKKCSQSDWDAILWYVKDELFDALEGRDADTLESLR